MKESTVDVILSRRSVRAFDSRKVPEEDINKILKCGIYAPNARNKQNWHFTVITNPQTMEEMNELVKDSMVKLGLEVESDYHVFYHAPLVVVVSSMIEGYSEINAGCTIENMAIAARSLGIDSCIIGQTRLMYHQRNNIDINRLLKIPEGYEHDISICFGYAKEDIPEAGPRKQGLIDYIK